MEKKGKSMESVTAPLSWLESEGLKRGDESKERDFLYTFLFRKKEKGIEIGRRGSFNKLFLPKKKF